MRRTATVSRTHRGQAVRLLKEFQLDTDEVFIRKVGEKIELSPRPAYWSRYLDNGPVASADFMDGVEDLLAQERKILAEAVFVVKKMSQDSSQRG